MFIEKIGIDLHSNNFTIAYRNELRNIIFKKINLFKNDEIDEFIKMLSKETILAVEATSNSNYFYRVFKKHVKKIIIVNTKKFDINKRSKKKNDREDAKRILIFLEAGMIEGIWIATDEIRNLRKLVSIQKKLESIQVCSKNMLGNILTANGIRRNKKDIMHDDNKSLFYDSNLNENQTFIAENLLRIIKYIEFKNEILKHAIVKSIGKDKRIELLLSIPGIGPYTAAAILSEIGDINRFESSKKLCSYAGIIPILDESNGKRKQKGITKSGRKKLRYFVCFAVNNAIRSSKIFREFYERICKKGNKKRAMVATARKLLSVIYEILSKEEPFKEYKEKLYEKKLNNWDKELSIKENDIKIAMNNFIESELLNFSHIKDKMIC
jgi:transposase